MSAGAWGLALGSAFFFGLALVLTQFGLRSMAAVQGAAVSIPVSAALCWVVAPFAVDFAAWRWDALLTFAAIGLLFPATVTLLTFEANRRMGPPVAGAVGNLAPLFAVLIAVSALGEALSLAKGAGIAAIVAGVTVLSLRRRAVSGAWPLWVLALPLLAAMIRGAVQPAVKVGLASWDSPLMAVAAGYAVSSAVVLGVVALGTKRGSERTGTAAFDRRGAAWFAAVGLCNVAAVFALYAALARGPVTLVSPVVASYPLVTLALSRLLLRGTPIGPQVLLGVTITVAGIALLLVGG
jgi:drug/metabolite transporter (DMT)-like permease